MLGSRAASCGTRILQERAENLGNAPMQNGSSDGEAALDQQKQNQDNKKINVIREKCKDDHQ
jgi:hypothetical protein